MTVGIISADAEGLIKGGVLKSWMFTVLMHHADTDVCLLKGFTDESFSFCQAPKRWY